MPDVDSFLAESVGLGIRWLREIVVRSAASCLQNEVLLLLSSSKEGERHDETTMKIRADQGSSDGYS
jgi:hypothetical protein